MSSFDLDNTVFVFDFDGTLVPQTKFINDEINVKQFQNFVLAVNPSVFRVNWTIATSRPQQDTFYIYDCLIRNNAKPTYMISTQNKELPSVNNEEEILFKKDCIDYYKRDCKGKKVIYVDNNKELCAKLSTYDSTINCISLATFVTLAVSRIMEIQK